MEKKDLKRIRLWLFDMDGTLYLGERLFDFTKELLAAIRRSGGEYLYLTNNSSKSVPDYVRKMERLGVAAAERDFLTSAQATAWYLHKEHEGRRLYVCGTASLQSELRAEGFPVVNDDPDSAECIVMGYDTELTQMAMERCGVTPEETAVVGDRIYTDVKSGLNAHCAGVLVMSGETTPEILAASPDRPDLVLSSAAEILDVLR